MKKTAQITTIFLLIFFMISCTVKVLKYQQPEKVLNKIQQLDKDAVLSFAIMSDNKGDSPESKKEFSRMVKWIKNSNDAFVIGLGDHVKINWKNDFLNFLQENKWWRNNFYPNVADGENEYYGKNQADWGAGAPILNTVNLGKRKNTTVRDNGCEYYSKIVSNGYTIHLIQLHYSDSPKSDSIAFNSSTKEYLIKTIDSINKDQKDIIIVGAHSRYGHWIDLLSKKDQKNVMEKADLILSATTHCFEKFDIENFKNKGALCINTGSITYPSKYCPAGFVQVHLLENPSRLAVQYINAESSQRKVQFNEYAYIKEINGPIYPANFRDADANEDPNRVIGKLKKEYSQKEMVVEIDNIYREITEADDTFANPAAGLNKGDITYKTLFNLFPYNNELYLLNISLDDYEQLSGEKGKFTGKKRVKLAINNYNGEHIIKKLNLPDEMVVKTGKKEIEILTNWLKNQK